ncbi:MAG: DUF397 domain-containing protein [Actinobacteria bacterium]|nr:MAG: DUF397 domain-containing protein [Actinomycetota bacterium]
MNTPWTKASRSGGNSGECVEVRRHDGTVQVRDSKDPDGPVLTFPPAEWHAFVHALTSGEFDR